MSYHETPAIEFSDSGYWIKFRNRSRFVPCTPKELEAAKVSIDASLAREALEKTKRGFKQGSNEKSYYYRHSDGTICIPGDPKCVPSGVRLEEIDNLASADRISKEMADQHYRKFQDDGAFTEMMESHMGSPRS